MSIAHSTDGRKTLQAQARETADGILREVHRYAPDDQTGALQSLLTDWLEVNRDPLLSELVLNEVARRLRLPVGSLKQLVKPSAKADSAEQFDSAVYRGVVSAESIPDGAKLTSGGVLYLKGEDLLRHASTGVEWLWHGLLAKGEITLLSGREKAGKSTLIFALLSALQTGEPFLCRQTKPCRVLLVEEAPKSVMDEAVQRFGLHEVLTVLKAHIPPPKQNLPSLCPELAEIVQAEQVDLLVIDTYGSFSGLKGEQENQAGAVQTALEPLRRLSDGFGVAVLLVHHNNRSDDEYRGSTALGAFVDTIITFKRAEGNRPRHRVLEAVGRHTEETSILIHLEEDGFTYTCEDPEESALQGALKAVLRVLDASAEPLTQGELVQLTGLQRQRVSEAVLHLTATGEVLRTGRGTRNEPYRYALCGRQIYSAETPSLYSAESIPEASSTPAQIYSAETTAYIGGIKSEETEPAKDLEEDPFSVPEDALLAYDPVAGRWFPAKKGGDSLDLC